jgi:protoporphyrinogen IX oxidase
MDYVYLKALHIVFIVSWFAALFYMVRLFIYTSDAQNKDEIAKPIITQQLLIMQRRLWYIIGWPGMIGTVVFGTWMLFFDGAHSAYFFSEAWMWLKLIAVLFLILYHLECQRIFQQQSAGVFKHSSLKLRLFNELATVFLVAIVFLVVVKSTSGLLWGLLGLIAFAAVLMLCVFLYRRAKGGEQANQEGTTGEKQEPQAPH